MKERKTRGFVVGLRIGLGLLVLAVAWMPGCGGEVSVSVPGCEQCPERCLKKSENLGECVTCLVDTHCQTKTSPTKRCTTRNTCICGSDQDCSNGQKCAGDKGCVECLNDADCPGDTRKVCDLSYQCVDCRSGQSRACVPEGKTACIQGTQTCSAGVWNPCEGWKDCEAGEKCEAEKCVPACKDECKEGEQRCTSPKETVPGTYEVCEKASSGCFAWSTQAKTCAAKEFCELGKCTAYVCPSPAPCKEGETRCVAQGALQTCERNALDCPVWSKETACPTESECRDSLKACAACEPSTSRPCYSGKAGTEGVGLCKPGTQTCKSDGSGYDACQGEITPTTEDCNGKDDDCNGTVDDGCDCINGQTRACYDGTTGCTQAGQGFNCKGTCRAGEQSCKSGKWEACDKQVKPSTKEACDGKDDNCDGNVDEGCTCTTNATQPCGSDTGECKKGTQTCDANGKWGACANEVTATKEVCDGKDNDCDGQTDEDFGTLGDECSVGKGECVNKGKLICKTDGSDVTCDATPKASATETCDGKDNDCDGQIDEDFGTLGDECSVGKGECTRKGKFICKPDGSDVTCDAKAGNPITETCDGKDNDCDGKVDEDLTQSCYTGPPNTEGTGACTKGEIRCINGSLSSCLDQVVPTDETCNNQKDDDCDGKVDEQSGRAVKFDGTGNIEVPHNNDLNPSGSFTIELWFNHDGLSTRTLALLVNKHKAGENTNGYHLKIQTPNEQCAFSWWNSSGGSQLIFGPCPSQVWVHAAFVYDDSTKAYRFYLNGKKTAEGNVTISIAANQHPLVFASETGASNNTPNFRGQFAAMRISKHARYNADFTPTCTFQADANTIAAWNLDDGGGNSVKDSSTNQHNGTLNSSSWTTGRSCNAATHGGCKP